MTCPSIVKERDQWRREHELRQQFSRRATATVTFKIGTDMNVALMLTHNRVQDTLSRPARRSSAPGVKKTIPPICLEYTHIRRMDLAMLSYRVAALRNRQRRTVASTRIYVLVNTLVHPRETMTVQDHASGFICCHGRFSCYLS